MTVCPRCGAPGEDGWCEACQRRITPGRAYRIEKRSSSRAPRRWLVKRKYLHLTAALMSLVLPGAGQVYKGRTLVGILWFVVVAGCYWLVGLPALLIHLMCVITAGSAAREVRIPFLYDGVSWTKR
ncbi:MAG TPA: hypothetical protein VF625_04435 [Longimicrobium sp.]|jgi:TM2 domain-containing membrane protein YozV